jgi:hypothetical protein
MSRNAPATPMLVLIGALVAFPPGSVRANGADCAPEVASASAGGSSGGGVGGPAVIGAPGGTGQGTGGMIELLGSGHVPSAAGPGLSGIANTAQTSGGAESATRPLRP